MSQARGARPLVLAALLLVLAAACAGGGSGPPAEADTSHVAAADPGSPLPSSWRLGPFMEIYVRGYMDSDGDGIGDLKGLTQKLDYLADLGVTGLWLMPIHRSQDHDHGYAVTDYRAIEPGYGTAADLDELVRQAHGRGIGVIIDYVMNHSGAQNALFLSSAYAPSGPWRDWYVWSSSRPGGWTVFGSDPWISSGGSWYYAPFWDQMPDFNLKNPEVVAYHQDNLRFWLNRGVDGFRFDAVGMLVENGPADWSDQPQSYLVMADIRTLLDAYQNRYMVCEDPGGAKAFDACGGAFDFDHRAQLIAAVLGSPDALQAVAAGPSGLTPEQALRRATFLANHDSFTGGRVLDQLGGNEARARLAAATVLLQPGTPFLYYGEEIGMSGAAALSGDWKIRTPMSWSADPGRAGFTSGTPFRALAANLVDHNVAAEVGKAGSLHTFYKTLIALRRSCPPLAAGSYEAPRVEGGLLSFQRSIGAEHALVLINYGATAATTTLSALPAGATLTALFPSGLADVAVDPGGQVSLTVSARGAQVYGWSL